MPTITAESIRQQFLALLADHDVPSTESVHETILIRDGFFCGRRFMAAGFQLVWFVEENQLKLFHPEGSLMRAGSASDFFAVTFRRAA